jgi:uncharacterized membrane protein YfcA
MESVALAAVLGVFIGLVLALTGAGGGVLAIPLLVFGLHLPVQQAAPVGLVAVGLAAALGAVMGLSQGIVRYRAAALIGIAGMCVAPLGVLAAQRLPNRPLLAAFAVVLIYTATRMLRKSAEVAPEPDDQPCRIEGGQSRLSWTPKCARAMVGTGLVSGFMSGMLGVGGGFVIVPALKRHTNLNMPTIQATSLAVIALVSVSGVTAATLQGTVPWSIGLPFSGGAAAGLLLGCQFAQRLNAQVLQSAFAWFALLVAMLMLARAAGWLTT